MDEIESRFRDDYSRFKEDVKSTQEKYNHVVEKSVTGPVLFIICESTEHQMDFVILNDRRE